MIQTVAPLGGRELPCGTLRGYPRLKDTDGRLHGSLYGLTSRHVALGDVYDHDRTFTSPAASHFLKVRSKSTIFDMPLSERATFTCQPDKNVSVPDSLRVAWSSRDYIEEKLQYLS